MIGLNNENPGYNAGSVDKMVPDDISYRLNPKKIVFLRHFVSTL